MKTKLFTLLGAAFVLCSQAFGQTTVRKDSVLLYESFETSSPTRGLWAEQASQSCSSYDWQFFTTSGGAALNTDICVEYPGASTSSGCYGILFSPIFQPPMETSTDSIIVDFYMYRASISTADYLSVYFTDTTGASIYGPANVYVDDNQSPTSAAGWDHLTWKVSLSDVLASATHGKFAIAFKGVSDAGANIIIDEIGIHHIYTLTKSLKVTSPVKGDTVTAGGTTAVSWSAQNVNHTLVSYSDDNGSTYNDIVLADASSHSYQWSIPTKETNSAYIKLADNDGTYSVTEGPFSIAWPEKLITLNGGDVIETQTTVPIEWRSRDNVSTVDIDFSVDGGVNWASITKGTTSPSNTNNVYQWAVPSTPTKTAKIRITDNNGMDVESANYFEIDHNSGVAPMAGQFGFTCYPNPAHSNVFVDFSAGLTENSELNLYDVKGILLVHKTIAAGTAQTSLDIHNLNSGVYILELKSNKSINKQQIVVN